jgi:hypothetical protein
MMEILLKYTSQRSVKYASRKISSDEGGLISNVFLCISYIPYFILFKYQVIALIPLLLRHELPFS